MSHITHIETSKGVFLFCDVPTGCRNPRIGSDPRCLWYDIEPPRLTDYQIALPEGNWQLVSDKTTRNYSEEEAAQLVDDKTERVYGSSFTDYRKNEHGITGFVGTALLSLGTLTESHGLSKENEYVILRNNEKS